MRYLILSDVHANWEALEAVLTHASGGYDEVLCCGDIVGYGADPNPAADWVRANVRQVVRGNHDKGCTGLVDLEWFNPTARLAALWTYRELTQQNLAYLQGLAEGPTAVEDEVFQILHGSPLDEDDYVVSAADAFQLLDYLDAAVSFFGHTHLQGGFLLHRNGTHPVRRVAPDADRLELRLREDVLSLINPGSVGQPRDGDPRAAYLVYTPEERLAVYHRVPYDIEKAQRKILRVGLPDVLARRLALGS